MIVYIKSYNEINEVLKNNNKNILILYFTSEKFSNVNIKLLNLISQKQNGNNIFYVIDIDNIPNVIKHMDITIFPIVKIYKQNEFIEELFPTYENFYNLINLIY